MLFSFYNSGLRVQSKTKSNDILYTYFINVNVAMNSHCGKTKLKKCMCVSLMYIPKLGQQMVKSAEIKRNQNSFQSLLIINVDFLHIQL